MVKKKKVTKVVKAARARLRPRRSPDAMRAIEGKILKVVAKAKEPMLSELIPRKLRLDVKVIEIPLKNLVASGLLKKTGSVRWSYYQATPEGKKAL